MRLIPHIQWDVINFSRSFVTVIFDFLLQTIQSARTTRIVSSEGPREPQKDATYTYNVYIQCIHTMYTIYIPWGANL